jgi:hypothetical protein
MLVRQELAAEMPLVAELSKALAWREKLIGGKKFT